MKQACWLPVVILAFGWPKQEDCLEFEVVMLGSIITLRLAQAKRDPVPENRTIEILGFRQYTWKALGIGYFYIRKCHGWSGH